MQYYPIEQEVPKLGMKKANLKDVGQNQKPKLAGTANKQGYQANHRNLAPSETCNQWEFYPGVGNGNFYGPPSGYDYYSQQWHSSAQGFQPIPPPQVRNRIIGFVWDTDFYLDMTIVCTLFYVVTVMLNVYTLILCVRIGLHHTHASIFLFNDP